MKNLLIILSMAFLIVSGCQDDILTLKGNVFLYEDGADKIFVGFSEEEIYLKWDDSLGVDSYQGSYTLNYIDDTTVVVEVKEKPKYWKANTWKIIIDGKKGFYSEDSKKYYKPYTKKIGND
ncbi:MAG TPA: hypothetical protein VMX17_14510 [Candidatus Glassbacteria bacterium]|nr:hypothetical protein [Candidatus Glassbacteria bacterium]